MPELPMFPLGTVLMPHMVLPLHVFEPRYRALLRDVLVGSREFGVVLIRRGPEVGGGDVRSDTGSVARILRAEESSDGRWLLVTVGTERLRVRRWLEDAPYPRAMVDQLPQEAPARVPPDLVKRLRRVLAMRTELGDEGMPATVELSDDPVVLGWQLPIVAPLTSFDAQRVLEADNPRERLLLLDELLEGLETDLAFRLDQEDRP